MNVPARPPQFSIATMLLVMTLVGICMTVARLSPVWGGAALTITCLSLVRTAIVARLRQPAEIATGGHKVDLFIESVAVILISFLAAGVTLFISFLVPTTIWDLLRPVNTLLEIMLILPAWLFCVSATIAAFVFVFWKTTFPVQR